MKTAVNRFIGFRGTQPWMNDPKGIGWCFWVGRLMVTRVRVTATGVHRGDGWAEFVAFGVAVGWYR